MAWAIPPIILVFISFAALLGCTGLIQLPPEPENNRATDLFPPGSPGDFLGGLCTPEEMKNKEFDVVVYGASGSMGQAIVSTLDQRHRDTLNWAIAGRSKQHLNNIFSTRKNSSAKEMIITSLDDVYKVQQMTKRAKVIINCASPYENDGSAELIRAAIESCTHYVDLSTELAWQSNITQKYHAAAKARGVVIVQSVGTAFADMLTMSVANDVMKMDKRPPEEVIMVWTAMNGRRTYGDLSSKQTALARHGIIRDPYILVPRIPAKMKLDPQMDGFAMLLADKPFDAKFHGWDDRIKMKLLPYYNSAFECAVIRRSMSLKFRRNPMHVREAGIARLQEQNKIFESQLIYKDPRFNTADIAPKPNYLPPEWERVAGSAGGFAVAFSRGYTPPSAMVSMTVHGDPSTLAIPMAAVEVARSLVEKTSSADSGLSSEAGCLTPIVATPDLEDRLKQANGGRFMTTFHMRDPVFPIASP